MKKDLLEILDIKKTDIISITGSGGKTSLMFYLAKLLKKKGSVLVTTSTKIKTPQKNEADFIYKSLDQYKKPDSNDIIVLGDYIKNKNKLKSVGFESLLQIKNDFDYILIEADGSRNLPLKYWKSYEPVIYDFTTKTIGIFPINLIGRKIDQSFIYNFKDFRENIKKDFVDKKVLGDLVKSGIFKDFEGEKYVFLNQAEDHINEARSVSNYLNQRFKGLKSFYGSIYKEEFYEN